jgi:hypothetical protein
LNPENEDIARQWNNKHVLAGKDTSRIIAGTVGNDVFYE